MNSNMEKPYVVGHVNKNDEGDSFVGVKAAHYIAPDDKQAVMLLNAEAMFSMIDVYKRQTKDGVCSAYVNAHYIGLFHV